MASANATALLEEVLAAIDAGDTERVLEKLGSTEESLRKRIAPKIRARQQELRGSGLFAAHPSGTSPQRVAAATACVATGTPRTIVRLYDWDGDAAAIDRAAAGRAVSFRGREFADALVDHLLDLDTRSNRLRGDPWGLVRWLVVNDVADKPEDPRYTAMMTWSVGKGLWRDPDRIYQGLVDDPALLEDEVWRLFEIDVVNELEQERVWGGAKSRTRGENAWQRALVRLAAEGRLERARLLDASLAALGRDFRASRIAWHAELHEALGPTREERAGRLVGYAPLLSSPVPSVVGFALGALQEIEDVVPAEVLVRGASGPLSLREKKQAVQILRLLERAIARDRRLTAELLQAAAPGLTHARSDVQEHTLRLLEQHKDVVSASVEIRSVILGFAESVAPPLRDRLDDLLGFAPPQPAAEPEPPLSTTERLAALDPGSPGAAAAVQAVQEAESGRWPSPRVPVPTPDLVDHVPARAISGVAELLEVAALVLEGDAPAGELDRLIDGVRAFRDADVAQPASGVLKRAREVLATPRAPGVASAQIAAALVCAWLEGEAASDAPVYPMRGGVAGPTAHESLAPRIDYYMDWRNARIPGYPEASARLYSLVCHEETRRVNGVSWPARTLSNRRISDDDLRAAGISDPEAARRAAGDPVLVFDAPDDDVDPAVQWLTALYADPGARGMKRELYWAADRGGARWLMSQHPYRTDVFFAIAATNAHVFSEDNIVYGFVDVVLERALDAFVEIGTAGWFGTAAALLVKAADVRRRAGDVVAATIADGRFDPQALAGAIAWLLREGTGNLRRVTETLRDVSRVSDLHRTQVLRLLEALLARLDPDTSGLHDPLELALELATALDLSIVESDSRAAIRAVVEKLSRGSKAGRAAQRLLDLPGDEESRRARQDAVARAMVDWAEAVAGA